MPRNTRHGFKLGVDCKLLCFVAPAGLEGSFKELGAGMAAGKSQAEIRRSAQSQVRPASRVVGRRPLHAGRVVSGCWPAPVFMAAPQGPGIVLQGELTPRHGRIVSGKSTRREAEGTGQAPREGDILEVLGGGDTVHYRVRWDNGHESAYFPSGGSITVIHKATKARVPKAPTH